MIQSRTKAVWLANAKVEPGFEREGPSNAPQQTGSASRWHKAPEASFFRPSYQTLMSLLPILVTEILLLLPWHKP
jgi:hypothetical protein